MRNDMKSLRNHRVLGRFEDYWRRWSDPDFSVNSPFNFEARITYKYKNKKIVETTGVMISRAGYSGGLVALSEKGRLKSEAFHLDFRPEFQTYYYGTRYHSLIVKGASPKMGGAYKVTIRPTKDDKR